ncbi:uncharacterized protein LOC143018512 isoform X1 [Oratosquilla oratoria]|uniref:uncharacterized protein LOC143018512 isoform X1 n=1 Tax=Oratosquilla oratoria TaxID=337810 RepID=UPI003F774E4A
MESDTESDDSSLPALHHDYSGTSDRKVKDLGPMESDTDSDDSSLPSLHHDYSGAKNDYSGAKKTEHCSVTTFEDLIADQREDKRISNQIKQIQNSTSIVNPRKGYYESPLPDLGIREENTIPSRPAGKKFLNEKKMLSVYTKESLQCEVYDKMSTSEVHKHIRMKLFQREYTQRKTVNGLIQYMFHLMCCLEESDAELQLATYQTLIYILQNNSHDFLDALGDELIFVLTNYGAEPHIMYKDENCIKGYNPVRKRLQSRKQQMEEQETIRTIPKRSFSLMLQTISVVLQGASGPPECLEDLSIIVANMLALSMDPYVFQMSQVSLYIMACVGHALELIPRSPFVKVMHFLIHDVYNEEDEMYHNIAYISLHSPQTEKGHKLFASLSYVALQHLLDLPKLDVMDIIEVVELKDLLCKNRRFIEEKFSFYQLHSFIQLMVCCVGHGPLCPAERQCLRKVQEMVTEITSSCRFREEPPATRLRAFVKQIVSKWTYISNPETQQNIRGLTA